MNEDDSPMIINLNETKKTRPRSSRKLKKQIEKNPRKKPRRKKWKNVPNISPPLKLNTIEDLLNIAWNYKGEDFEWFTLWNMIPVLTEINRLVGMKQAKEKIIDLITYYIQDLHLYKKKHEKDPSDGDMMHGVIYGPPGVGKTTLAHILAKIYCKMGCLPTENVIIAKRTDFIGKWIGHSDSKTMNLLQKSLGGVLFIDEAYNMGSEKVDSFSKASIDIINQFISEHKGEMVCLIAGYENELKECFFSVNEGLERRFPWKFKIEPYTGEELYEMFIKKVSHEEWKLSKDAIDSGFFNKNKSSFIFFGGDIDTFFTFCKTCHSRRIFGNSNSTKKELNKDDITRGFERFKEGKINEKSSIENIMYI